MHFTTRTSKYRRQTAAIVVGNINIEIPVGIGSEVGLSGQTVKRYFDEVVMETRNATKLKAPRVLGIDEVYICKRPRAVFMDIDNHTMIEMLETNTKEALRVFISSMEGYENIVAVTMDMCPAYKYVCKELIPNAKVIIDKFHVIAFANKALLKYFNAIKSKANTAQKQELWGVRKIILTGKEKLTADKVAKRDAIFKTYEELKIAYWLKEDLRDVYLAADSREAFELFYMWEESVPKSMKHFVKIKNTLNRCKQEVINYFKFSDENLTNSFTESKNRLTKDYVRLGRNYNFETIRAKALLRQHIEKKPKIGELGFS
jgi:transposase